MTVALVVVACIIGWLLFVYVIIRLLEENRRLTAAAIAPRPESAMAVMRSPQPKRQRDEGENVPRQIGA